MTETKQAYNTADVSQRISATGHELAAKRAALQALEQNFLRAKVTAELLGHAIPALPTELEMLPVEIADLVAKIPMLKELLRESRAVDARSRLATAKTEVSAAYTALQKAAAREQAAAIEYADSQKARDHADTRWTHAENVVSAIEDELVRLVGELK